MRILCDRVSWRGVSEMDYVVVEGNIRDKFERFIKNSRIDLVVMGKS